MLNCRLLLSWCFVGIVFVGIVFVGSMNMNSAWGQKAKLSRQRERVMLKMEKDYLASLDAASTPLKAGVKVTLWLHSGKKWDGEVTDVVAGRLPGTLKQIGIVTGGKKQRFTTDAVSRIEANDKVFEVLLDTDKKGQVLLDVVRRDEVVAARLKGSRQSLWPEPTTAQQEATVEEYKKYLKEVEAAFPNLKFTLHETQFFLFLTDIPANQIGGYIANLDEMYEQLCGLFALPPQRNIWLGKAIIISFLNQSDFYAFEERFQHVDGTGKYGICHSSSTGKVVTACYRGSDPIAFAGMLVHETSHGFLHRFRSNVHIPSWINEGIAEWISVAVVSADKQVALKQRVAIERMRSTSSMDGTFEASGLNFGGQNAWQYGAASGLTDFLIRRDPTLYRAFLTAIKEGRSWEDSLKEVYDMTPADLARTFGQSFGVPNLQP